jgi:hypothetical protein
MPHVNELHDQHDPILMVSLASGDLAAADRDYATATSLVASCADCARLHDDVLAIASATKALPPAARARDFRISPEQAAKLRPAGLRGVLARLTAPGAVFSRQLGVGLATLGIAGLLIGSLPPIQLGMGGAASAPSQPASAEGAVQAPSTAASAPAVSIAPDGAFAGGAEAEASAVPYRDTSAPQPSDRLSSARNIVDGTPASAAPASPAAAAAATSPPRDEATSPPGDRVATLEATTDGGSSDGPSPLMIVSIVLLVAGAVVLVARRLASGGSPG